MKESVVGIDLGGTSTKIGLVTKEGEFLAYKAIPTNSKIDYQLFFKTVCENIHQLQHELDCQTTFEGIGIGAPTGNYCTGYIENASNLSWEGKVPVVKLMEEYTNLPTVLINDANAWAVGEMKYGAARDIKNFISITIGTGLGAGIIANGELITGYHGHAGEIGHCTVYYDGRCCSCGHSGCLETYVSGPGLVITAQELMKKTDLESKLRSLPNSELDAEKVTKAAQQNDGLALKAFEQTGDILGLKIADLVTCLNPEAIIVSGGLARAGSLILEPAQKSMENHLLDMFKNSVKILPSSLMGKNAAILGAAASIWMKLEHRQISNP